MTAPIAHGRTDDGTNGCVHEAIFLECGRRVRSLGRNLLFPRCCFAHVVDDRLFCRVHGAGHQILAPLGRMMHPLFFLLLLSLRHRLFYERVGMHVQSRCSRPYDFKTINC